MLCIVVVFQVVIVIYKTYCHCGRCLWLAHCPAGSSSSRRSGYELWGLVRDAKATGALAKAGRSMQYSLVANVFSTLFPDDFDRVSWCSVADNIIYMDLMLPVLSSPPFYPWANSRLFMGCNKLLNTTALYACIQSRLY